MGAAVTRLLAKTMPKKKTPSIWGAWKPYYSNPPLPPEGETRGKAGDAQTPSYCIYIPPNRPRSSQVPPGLCGGGSYHNRLHRTHVHHPRGRSGPGIHCPYSVPRPTLALSPALTTVASLLPRNKTQAPRDSPTTAMPQLPHQRRPRQRPIRPLLQGPRHIDVPQDPFDIIRYSALSSAYT